MAGEWLSVRGKYVDELFRRERGSEPEKTDGRTIVRMSIERITDQCSRVDIKPNILQGITQVFYASRVRWRSVIARRLGLP